MNVILINLYFESKINNLFPSKLNYILIVCASGLYTVLVLLNKSY